MPTPPLTRIVLYKHGIGYFEREGPVEGDATLTLTFKQAEVSDVLKSLIVLDLHGGHVASVSYDSTKPLQQLLSEVALSIPDENGLHGLLPQLKGARVRFHQTAATPVEGAILGLDTIQKQTADGLLETPTLSLLTEDGQVKGFDLPALAALQILDDAVRRDLDFYLRTQLSAKKKDARGFSIFARGEGRRMLRLGYTVEAPVWKATYRLILGDEGRPPMIQGWAVVDNTQDEDWENVQLALIAGLPVSFVHDLYTPRYIKRPEVAVMETTGVLPPAVEASMPFLGPIEPEMPPGAAAAAPPAPAQALRGIPQSRLMGMTRSAVSSTPAQVRERKIGDLFAYEIEHPVTIKRNQAALVPIVLRPFQGRPVLLYNKRTRAENPMRCVEFGNTTGLTLEGGPVTVLEGGDYVGEAMLDTLKPDEERLVPFAVELGVGVLDNIDSHDNRVSRVVIRNGQWSARHGQVRQTTYTVHNKSDTEQVLYLDHPREGGDWDLFESAAPHEITESYWRFRFPLPAQKVTSFVVWQRRLQQQTYVLADASASLLNLWIKQRYLDERTERVIRQALDLRKKVADAEEQIQRVERERATIQTEQERVRENLKALGDRASEKELRERFIRTLNAQEDRLERIESEVAAQTAERDECRARVNDLLARLEYEADVTERPPGRREGGKETNQNS